MTITVEGSANHNAQPAIWIRHLRRYLAPEDPETLRCASDGMKRERTEGRKG